MYQTSLEKDLKGDSSGTLKRLFVSLSTVYSFNILLLKLNLNCFWNFKGNRDESEKTDKDQAYKDAQTLLRAGELFQGTDESAFNEVLCQRNRSQLKLIFEEYQKLTGHEFEQAIKNEFSGTTKDMLLALVHCIRDKVDYLAERLYKSMEGIGTDDRVLIRIIVSRAENDLGDIKEAFQRKYGKSLAEFVKVIAKLVYLCDCYF